MHTNYFHFVLQWNWKLSIPLALGVYVFVCGTGNGLFVLCAIISNDELYDKYGFNSFGNWFCHYFYINGTFFSLPYSLILYDMLEKVHQYELINIHYNFSKLFFRQSEINLPYGNTGKNLINLFFFLNVKKCNLLN